MQHQVTGIVADLLCNKRAILYARAWRSDCDMLSISQLMVRLWIAEEARLGVSRPGGVLQNLWRPLQSHNLRVEHPPLHAEAPTLPVEQGAQGSPSRGGEKSLDQEAALRKSVGHLDLRGKLAGVLSLVGFDQSTADGLGPHEVKALFMAMHFLDFRAAEAWQEVR
ncbi:unnamed protein product, partial [Discosporangium mesarthrocarpum]